ncbi:MAG: hypothetical protein HGA47_15385, partial [Zoogloea sp.]|nr:hypothetical protein [Zoogloea sp.]
AIGWLAGTESGLRLAVHLAGPLSGGMLEASGPSGSLLRAPRLGRVHFRNADTDLALYDLAIDWSPSALLAGRLDIARLAVGSVEVGTLPSDKPRKLPVSLQLPLALRIVDARLGRLTVTPLGRDGKPAGKPFVVTDARAALDSDGRHHHLRAASATLPFGELKAAGQIAGNAPFKLSAQLDLATAQFGEAYRVHAEAGGSLVELSLALRAQGAGLAGSGTVVATPFSPVPFRSAKLALKGLDPSRFNAAAPQALLDLDAELLPQVPAGLPPGRPVPVEQWVVAGPLRLANRKPGQYDQQALPLQSLSMQLRWAAGGLAVSGLDLRLPGDGRISGSANWRPGQASDPVGRLDADLRVAGVDARRLDQRLPSSRIAGSLKAQGSSAEQTLVADLADPRFALRLTGKHAGSVLMLSRGELRAGKAQASVSGQMRLDAGRGFEAKAVLAHFDPHAFFSSLPSADINSRFGLRGQLAPQLAAALDVQLDPSRLEGRPLSGGGQLALAGKTISRAQLAFEVAGNRLSADGRYGRPGDVLKLVVDAPALDAIGHGFAGHARLNAGLHGTVAEPAGEFAMVAGDLALPG